MYIHVLFIDHLIFIALVSIFILVVVNDGATSNPSLKVHDRQSFLYSALTFTETFLYETFHPRVIERQGSPFEGVRGGAHNELFGVAVGPPDNFVDINEQGNVLELFVRQII